MLCVKEWLCDAMCEGMGVWCCECIFIPVTATYAIGTPIL